MPTESNYIYRATDWIMKLVIVNLLWLLFNLPIVFVMLNVFIAERMEDLLALIIPVFICIPIFLFPSTTAMFASVRDWVLKKEQNKNIFSQFWSHYKNNYKKSMLGGILITIFWAFLIADLLFFLGKSKVLIFLFMMVGVILYSLTMNFYSVLVHDDDRMLTSLKKASLITISSPFIILIVTLGTVIILFISIYVLQFLLLLCTGSLIAWLSFYMFNRFYLKKINPIE